jgi:acyl-CoA thioesterase
LYNTKLSVHGHAKRIISHIITDLALFEQLQRSKMQSVKNLMSKDQFAKHSGIELLDVSKGTAKARMQIKKEHLNGIGIVHGGAIFTLADFVFAAASNSHGILAVAINVSIS